MDKLYFFIFLIFHYLADYVFQTPKMGLNKSKGVKWLTYHIIEYAFVFGVLTIIYVGLHKALPIITINAVTHFAIDFCTSRASAHFYYKQNMKWFWIVLGFDQLLHLGILLYSV